MCRGPSSSNPRPLMTSQDSGRPASDVFTASRLRTLSRQPDDLSQMLMQLQLQQQGVNGYPPPLPASSRLLQAPMQQIQAGQQLSGRLSQLHCAAAQQQALQPQDCQMSKYMDQLQQQHPQQQHPQHPQQQHRQQQQQHYCRLPSEAAMTYVHQEPAWHHGQHQHHAQQRGHVHGQGHHRKGPVGNSINLNKQIMASSCLVELSTLVHHHGHSFDFFNISSAIAKVPKLVGPTAVGCQLTPEAKALVDSLSKLMINRLPEFDGRGLANVAWSFGKLKYVPTQAIPNLLAQEALAKIGSLSPQNISNMLWAFVYMHHYNEPLLRAMASLVRAKVDQFKPQELANVLWAMASLEFSDPAMVQVVARRAVNIRVLFKEQELSNIIWALGKLQHADLDIYSVLLREATDKLQFFLPQGIANIAWSAAALGVDPGPFLPRVVRMHGHNLAAFDVQALANLLWGMATCGYRDEAFLSAALQEATRRLDRMAPQHLCNLLWSWAALDACRDAGMVAAWALHVLQKAETLDPQGLANAAWAFAKLGCRDTALFGAMADAASFRVDELSPQGLCNVAWAFATAGCYQPQLQAKLVQQALLELGEMTAPQCATLARAFSTSGHYDAALLDGLLLRAAQLLPLASPQDLSDLLWAAARVGHGLGAASELLVARALELARAMSPAQLVDVFWGLAVMGLLDQPRFAELGALLAAALPGLPPELQRCAFHAQLMFWSWLVHALGLPFGQVSPALLPTLPEPLHSQARALWLAAAAVPSASRFQSEVCQALAAVGVEHTAWQATDDGLLRADVGLCLEGRLVALETEGPGSFSTNAPHLPLSDVLIRRTLLQDRGWHVVTLRQGDWEMMGSTLAERGSSLMQLVSSSLRPGTWSPTPASSKPAAAAAPAPAALPPGATAHVSKALPPSAGPAGPGASELDALNNLLACLNSNPALASVAHDQELLAQVLRFKQQQQQVQAGVALAQQPQAVASPCGRKSATQAWVNHLQLGGASCPNSSSTSSSPTCSRPEPNPLLGPPGAIVCSATVSSLGGGPCSSVEGAVPSAAPGSRPASQGGSHKPGSATSTPRSAGSGRQDLVFSCQGEMLAQLEGTLRGGLLSLRLQGPARS